MTKKKLFTIALAPLAMTGIAAAPQAAAQDEPGYERTVHCSASFFAYAAYLEEFPQERPSEVLFASPDKEAAVNFLRDKAITRSHQARRMTTDEQLQQDMDDAYGAVVERVNTSDEKQDVLLALVLDCINL